MNPTLDGMLNFHQSALNLRAWRQQLLASNIANADTPGYKAGDIDFAAALRAAESGRTAASALARTAPGHLGSADRAPGGTPVLYRAPLQPSLDGNSVDLNIERARFADNAVRYEANLAFISNQIKTMLAAIQG